MVKNNPKFPNVKCYFCKRKATWRYDHPEDPSSPYYFCNFHSDSDFNRLWWRKVLTPGGKKGFVYQIYRHKN